MDSKKEWRYDSSSRNITYGNFTITDIPSQQIADVFIERAIELNIAEHFNNLDQINFIGSYLIAKIEDEFNG